MLYVCEICGKSFKDHQQCFKHEYNEKLLKKNPKNRKGNNLQKKQKFYYREEPKKKEI